MRTILELAAPPAPLRGRVRVGARRTTGNDKRGVEARGKGIRWQHLVPIPSAEDLGAINAALRFSIAPGLLTQFGADRATLGDASARGTGALAGQKTATTDERAVAAEGHLLVMAVRDAVSRTRGAPATLRTGVGIGDGLKDRDTQRVIAALRAIVEHGTALATCGVTSDDVADARRLADALFAAQGQQDAKMDARSATTEDRNDVQLRMEAAIDEISSRGALATLRDRVAAERFQRLVSHTGPTAEDEQQAGPEPAAQAAP